MSGELMIRIASKSPWRLRSKLKTVTAGLFICLNLGVDPPDIVKTNPCAKTECWIDPTQLPAPKAIDAIGRSEGGAQTVSAGIDYVFRSASTIRDFKSQGQIQGGE